MTVAVSLAGVHTHSLVNKKEIINKDSNIMPICIG